MNIHDPLAQVGIVDGFQSLAVFLDDLLEDMLDIAMISLETAKHFVDQRSVLHDKQVRIENTRILRADGRNDAALDFKQFDARRNQRGLEPGNLAGELLPRDVPREDLLILGIINKGRKMSDSLSYRNTLESLFHFFLKGGIHRRDDDKKTLSAQSEGFPPQCFGALTVPAWRSSRRRWTMRLAISKTISSSSNRR